MDFQTERESVIIPQQVLLFTQPELCLCSLFAHTEAAGVQASLSNHGMLAPRKARSEGIGESA